MNMEICRLTIPIDVNTQNPNRRGKLRSWLQAKAAHKEAAHTMWLLAGKPKASSPVIVSVIIRRYRVLDEDNAWASCKAIFDALFNRNRHLYGITPDDSAKWVTLGTMTQETGGCWYCRPEVEVIVSTQQ